ncbi:MAG: hypothetical protein ACK5B9_13390 [Flavobacteriia bacterium]|jgi:hypothetical protein
MSTEKNSTSQVILLVLSFVISLAILFYFWVLHTNFEEKINVIVMILALAYVTIELIKRNFFKLISKWHRIYYIGLFAVVAPIALENKISLLGIKWINHIGLFFLIIPLMLEASLILKSTKN